MGKSRPSLGRYSRRTNQRKATASTTKRKVPISPWNSPFKSPFKSPLYKHRPSPAHKKIKTSVTTSARSLFRHPYNADQDIRSVSSDAFDSLSHSTRSIEDEHDTNDSTSEVIKLLPEVMKTLSEHGELDLQLKKFFELVAEGKFPLTNIAFLLWIEVVKWFGCSSTTRMRYSTHTKLFWKLGWRLFGTRFVHFMGGFKSHSCLITNTSEKGSFSPSTAEINFAVPDVSVLRDFDPYEQHGARMPGIYTDVMAVLSRGLHKKSACITFDGKKIKQGLTEDSGDVDLLNHEKGPSLQQRKDELTSDKLKVEKAMFDLKSMVDIDKDELLKVLEMSLKKISLKVNEVLILKEKKEYCKKKLIERSGETDWRKGRYAFAISAVTAFIYEINEFVKMCQCVLENICSHIAFLHKSNYLKGNSINLKMTDKYVSISGQTEQKSTRLVKQRTDEWYSLRSKAKVTGSTLYKAIGCGTLASQKDHFEKVVCGIEERNPSEFITKAMQHGTENEENAVGTIVGKIMPVLEPHLKFFEEGCVVVNNEKDEPFFVVSPDGSLRAEKDLSSTQVAIEIKCPVLKVHTEFPEIYYLQCLAEIFVLNVPYLIYVCWTEDVSTVFKVHRDDATLTQALKLANEIYGVENPVKPTKQQTVTQNSNKTLFVKVRRSNS